ncbi:MAG TPA: type IV toxin-antitoxin system AbiEi family antitoxin [Nitrososphaerales archaeon]|nr:type IV toxin-antitoxin system AbiEi family antitoxin [Nitrososphaerales archaeon]
MLREPKTEFGATETAIYRKLVQPDAPKLLTTKDAMETIVPTVSINSLTHSMSLLESKRVLKRIGKGVYLNRSTGLAPKIVDVIPWVFKGTRYYLGLNAIANHWGLSPQIPYSYHVIYMPKNEAQRKRITSWCSMLNRFEKELGGTLVPVLSRAGMSDKGVSQSIFEGSQLPISTIERTIVDTVIYTKEIGGAGEALTWARAALSKSIDYAELEQIAKKAYSSVKSVAVRLGFLLETASSEKPHDEVTDALEKLVGELEELVSKTRATYNWGREKRGSRYVEKWHLRVSSSYLRQLREVSRRE